MKELIASRSRVEIDYVSIVDTERLEPVEKLEGEILIAVAAKVGEARLIDNLMLTLQTL